MGVRTQQRFCFYARRAAHLRCPLAALVRVRRSGDMYLSFKSDTWTSTTPQRRRTPRRLLRSGLAMLCCIIGIATQQSHAQRPDSPARVGLVLSGGSAKGFAHIGVLDVLERAGVPLAVITGTSMGSIVGGLYAAGYSSEMLRHVAVNEDWTNMFRSSASRRDMRADQKVESGRYLLSVPIRDGRVQLPEGLLGTQRIAATLSRLVWSADTVRDLRRLPIPFAAVATDLSTGEAFVLDRGPLSGAMRASMALPGVFAPAASDSRRLIDGGLARNLPAREARDLGADFLICVDVSDPLAEAEELVSAFGIMMQALTFRMNELTSAQRQLCDVIIEPDITELAALAFDRSREWIARGAAAAREALPSIRRLAAARNVQFSGGRARPVATRDSVRVRHVELRGAPNAARLLRQYGIALSGWISAEDAEQISRRLYATGRFEHVFYHLSPVPDGQVDLVFETTPANRSRLAFGFRYDNRYKAALLFDAELHDQLVPGAAVTLEARLGEQLRLAAQLRPGIDRQARWVHSLRASYVRTPLDIFDNERAVATAQVQLLSLEAFVGASLSTSSIGGLRLTGTHSTAEALIAPQSGSRTRLFHTIAALWWTDTYDRAVFPRRGVSLFLQSELADRKLGSSLSYDRHWADVEARLPVRPSLTLLARASAGAGHGRNLPLFERFFLGGTVPNAVLPGRSIAFPALDTEERSGRVLHLGELGVQYRLRGETYLTGRGSLANTFERWPANPRPADYIKAYTMSVGTLTPAGPLSLTLAGRALKQRPNLAIEVGYRF